MSEVLKFASVDPSLSALGYSVFDSGYPVSWGCIKTESSSSLKSISELLRLKKLGKELVPIFQECKVIVFEDPIGSKSASATRSLGMIKGFLVGLALGYGTDDLIAIPARQVKTYFAGKNTKDKEEIWNCVKSRLRPETISEIIKLPKYQLYAVSDALAVGFFYLEHYVNYPRLQSGACRE